MQENRSNAPDAPGSKKQSAAMPGQEVYEWIEAFVVAVVAVLAVFIFVARLVGVDGNSMRNTLLDGDRLIVINATLYRDPCPGDIVILRKEGVFEGEPIVKRIIATGGQTVDIDFTFGHVYVDGELLEEPYILEPTYLSEGTAFPLVVPEGSVFVMGDNRNGSSDSRDIRLGTVDTRYIIGKAAVLLIPGVDPDTHRRDWGRVGVIWQ